MSDFDDEGINKYTGTNYDQDGFNRNGFDKNGINKFTKTKYDRDGFDKSGYNKEFNTRDELAPKPNVSTSSYSSHKKRHHRDMTLPKVKIGLFDKFKMSKITDRANDEILYEYVLTELEENIKFKGLWAKAYANSEGNENKIEPLYMQYRVQSIKDSLTSMEIAYNEMAKQELFQYIKNRLT
jgi:hypothetical protein